VTQRYSAFISYSHADTPVARWLHKALESYRLPKGLVGTASPFGPVPARLPPVFRDRDELPASADLGGELRAALAAARFQIVLCSPRSAKSMWVNEEILAFKRAHGEARVLPLIIGGEPYAGDERECFPPALRFKLAEDGSLSDVPAEPIAADIRDGKDGKRLALLKLIAGITGLKLDQLAQRDAARRQRQLLAITAGSLSIALVTIGLAIYANIQRAEAVRQQLVATRSLDFLIGTFEIANPATENPRSITALTILDRASKRAATELPQEPLVSARLLAATGAIYLNLGLPKEAVADLEQALTRLSAQSPDRARILLRLASAATRANDVETAARHIAAALDAFDPGTDEGKLLMSDVHEQQGLLARTRGDQRQALAKLSQSIAAIAADPARHWNDLARRHSLIGRARLKLRDVAGADQDLAIAEKLYRQHLGGNHRTTAAAISNRALAAFEAGNIAAALPRIAAANRIYARVLEGDHPTLADNLILQGRIQTTAGNAEAALAALNRAKGIYSRLYGPGNAAVGDALFYMAEAESQRRRIAVALAHVAAAGRIYDAEYGPDDPDQAELLMLKARVLARGGRAADALAICKTAMSLQRRIKAAPAVLADAQRQCDALPTI
jgi:tetratricopeptide (TPR) repeat protein